MQLLSSSNQNYEDNDRDGISFVAQYLHNQVLVTLGDSSRSTKKFQITGVSNLGRKQMARHGVKERIFEHDPAYMHENLEIEKRRTFSPKNL